MLKDLLIKEEEMRLSQKTQKLLSSIENRQDIDWMDMIDHLQRQLIIETIGENASEEEIVLGLK